MSDAAIVVERLVKRFGDLRAVDGVDLEVPTGTVLGLLGPNGAGKTTIVRTLTTILHPDEGRASVLGLDVVRQAKAVRRVIGLAGQYAAVDENLTGRENLRLMGELTHQPTSSIRPRADELLERFDLVVAGERPVRTYSGGMRRRLDLAAALVHRPPVLFLDEPTTGLDPPGRTELWAMIGELVGDGTTVLLTTQYLEEADRLADHIVLIDGGQVVAEGSATELKSKFGTTVIDVTLRNERAAGRARKLLTAVGHVEPAGGWGPSGVPAGVSAGRSPERTNVSVLVPDSGRSLQRVVRLLNENRLTAEKVAVREPTLDDVFMQLTGRAPEERVHDGQISVDRNEDSRGAA
jgi:daunorubicin resistance ABC transporter ATP-binding subunit